MLEDKLKKFFSLDDIGTEAANDNFLFQAKLDKINKREDKLIENLNLKNVCVLDEYNQAVGKLKEYNRAVEKLKEYNQVVGNLKNEEKKIEDTNNQEEVDVVLIFALSEERTAALRAFGIKDEKYEQKYSLEGRFFYQKFKYDMCTIVAVTQPKMGSTMAASLTTRAIMCFSPHLIVMTGVCAGRQGKTCIGDVLVASSVYDYTVGKVTERGKVVRPDPVQCDNDALNIYIQKIENNDDSRFNKEIKSRWGDSERPCENSRVHIKALGTGSSVVADGKIIEEAISTQDDLFGIDMEGYGVAIAAAQLNVPFFIVKGIQDFADNEKNIVEKRKNARQYAGFVSAVLASIIIVEKKKLLNGNRK